MIEQVRRALERAVYSPSGDNCQPWRFSWDGKALSIAHDPARGRHTLNPRDQASHVALGALVESIVIAATTAGLEARAALGALEDTAGIWARIDFQAVPVAPDPLAEALSVRTTDRRRYDGGDPAVVAAIARSAEQGVDGVCTRAFEPEPPLREAIVTAESSLLAFGDALRDTAAWVRFSEHEAHVTRDGMRVANLGIAPHEARMFRLVANHGWLRRLMAPAMRAQMRGVVRAQLASSAAVVCYGARDASPPSFVKVGRVAMRTWLGLAAAGYGAQPLTLSGMGPHWARSGLLAGVVPPQVNASLAALGESLVELLPAGHRPLWMMRAGLSSPLPANMRTLRREVVIA